MRDTAYYAIQIARAAHERHGVPLLLAAAQPMAPMPFADAKAVVRACAAATGDSDLGALAGADGAPLGAAGLSLARSPRIEDALVACAGLLQRTTDVLQHACTVERDVVTLETTFLDGDALYQKLVGDLLVAVAIANLRRAGIEDAVVRRKGNAGLVLRREALQLPHHIDADVDEVLAALQLHEGLGRDVGARISAAMGIHGRMLNVRELAAELQLSPRTLQSRLKHEGTSVRVILDRLRRHLYAHWLSNGLTHEEMAWRLGFSEPAAFRRARRRWTQLRA